MLQTLDNVSATEKLNRVSKSLASSVPEEALANMQQLATKDEMKKLFSNMDDLAELPQTLNLSCFVVNQSIKRVFSAAVNEKKFEI